jgi:hypothetical protein
MSIFSTFSQRTNDFQPDMATSKYLSRTADYAISHYQNAVKSTPSSQAAPPSCFNNDGNSYLRCFECTGNLQDIDCDHSKDGGNEDFLAFTGDEIYAMWCAEEGTPQTIVCPPYKHLK